MGLCTQTASPGLRAWASARVMSVCLLPHDITTLLEAPLTRRLDVARHETVAARALLHQSRQDLPISTHDIELVRGTFLEHEAVEPSAGTLDGTAPFQLTVGGARPALYGRCHSPCSLRPCRNNRA